MKVSAHTCERTMTILRNLHAANSVTDEDAAFARQHLQICENCRADSAIIRGMAVDDRLSSDASLVAKRVATGALRRLHESESLSPSGTKVSWKSAGRFAAAAAIGGILALSYWWVGSPSDESAPVVASVPEPSSVEKRGADNRTPITEKPSVSNAERIPVSANERLLMLPTGVSVLLHPGAALQVSTPTQEEMAVVLKSGDIFVSVDPHRSGPPFSVVTAKGRITVTGTLFSVSTRQRRQRVTVLRGSVNVTDSAGMNRNVKTGESLSITEGAVNPIDKEEQHLLGAVAERLDIGNHPQTEIIDMRPPDRVASKDGKSPLSSAVATKEAIRKTTVIAPSGPTIKTLLSEVRTHRRNRKWRDAADAYRDIIRHHPNSRAAADAWVALGEIQLNKLKQPGKALGSYNEYLGLNRLPLIEEALIGKAKALGALSRTDEEQQALRRFQDAFPCSAYAPAVEKRLAEIEQFEK